MPLIFATAVFFVIVIAGLAILVGIVATLERKGALMSQTGFGTLSLLLLIGLVLYVAGGGGV